MTSSAVAFVEGGVQDACDDACSICLESFCDDDPATVLAPLFPRDPFLSVSLFGVVVVCTRYWNLLLDFIFFPVLCFRLEICCCQFMRCVRN
jgi:hypothetical protein